MTCAILIIILIIIIIIIIIIISATAAHSGLGSSNRILVSFPLVRRQSSINFQQFRGNEWSAGRVPQQSGFLHRNYSYK